MNLQGKGRWARRKTYAFIPIEVSREPMTTKGRTKGKDKKKGRGHSHKRPQVVKMGATAFGPPPNLMRGGSLKEAPSL